MFQFTKIIGVAITSLIGYVIVKPSKPEIAFVISIIGSCFVISMCLDMIVEIINNLTNFVEKTGVNQELFLAVLKVVGIGYLTEYCAEVCQDAGNNSIGDKVIFAGKIFILYLSLPIIDNLLNIIVEILP